MSLVFCSNFVEGSTEAIDQTPRAAARPLESPATPDMSLIMNDFEDSDGEDDETLLSFSLQSDRDNTDLSEGVADTPMILDSTPANPDRQDTEGIQSADSHMPGPMVNGSPPLRAHALLHEPQVSPSKLTIVIRDVAYTTYYAMLYYVGFLYSLPADLELIQKN
jgi:hypothetical protein